MLKFTLTMISVILLVVTIVSAMVMFNLDSINFASILKTYSDDINIIKDQLKGNYKKVNDAKLASTHYLAKDQSYELLRLAVERNCLEKRLQYLHAKTASTRKLESKIGVSLCITIIAFVLFLIASSSAGML